jgi:hypothetical protein
MIPFNGLINTYDYSLEKCGEEGLPVRSTVPEPIIGQRSLSLIPYCWQDHRASSFLPQVIRRALRCYRERTYPPKSQLVIIHQFLIDMGARDRRSLSVGINTLELIFSANKSYE